MDLVTDFLSRSVPWPGDGPGFVNIHWLRPLQSDPTKKIWSGKPNRSVNEFQNNISWGLTQKTSIFDMYFCLSLQAQSGISKNGWPVPKRRAEDALAFSAVWLDVDVKDPPKGYESLEAALAAVDAFTTHFCLPRASARVGSGGGVHVYWFSNKVLTPQEWRPYAEALKNAAIKFGLRCDAGVTTDAARVLRIPGTFNYKTDPPRKTDIIELLPREQDYDFSVALKGLPVVAVPKPNGKVTAAVIELPGWVKEGPATAFKNGDKTESLSEGIEKESALLQWAPLEKECAFLKNALETGGKDYSQPEWNLTTLVATFLEDGNDYAHRMASLHPDYDPQSTEDLWARKNRERASRGIGWPSCRAIQGAGSKVCGSCPHRDAGKSPLHFSSPSGPPAKPANAHSTQQILGTIDLPHGYIFDTDGDIAKREWVGKGKNRSQENLKLFTTKLSWAWASHPPALNFKTTMDLGREPQPVHIPLGICPTPQLLMRLAEQGVTYVPANKRFAEDFCVSLLSKLQNLQKSQEANPFGWWQGDDGEHHGFVYGGKVFKDDGTTQGSGYVDYNLRDIYMPCGDKMPWLDACKMITDQHRPELEAIIASAFAAPLMPFTGEYATTMAPFSRESGVGKSTAIKVAQAVWMNHKLGKEVSTSTARSIMSHMGQVRNLPVYWDEIKDKKDQEHVGQTFIQATLGLEGSRLDRNSERRSRGDWQTILMICSNSSFVDFLVERNSLTDAQVLRVFEYEIALAPPGAPGRIKSHVASRITQKLEGNYGIVGLEYAQLLGRHPENADKFTTERIEAFNARVNAVSGERYWVALCGTLIAGAHYANTLGANLDLLALENFLARTFEYNRKRLQDEEVTGGSFNNVQQHLSTYLNTFIGNTVWTDASGHGGRNELIVPLHAPHGPYAKPAFIHYLVNERVVRINQNHFKGYLNANKMQPYTMICGLADHLGMKRKKLCLASGTPNRVLQAWLLEIPIPVGSLLEPLMYAYSDAAKQITAPVTAAPP